ncbi:hypothetical protein D3C87_1065450 [compost metagenome]
MSSVARGSESGGGGSASDRAPISSHEIKSLVEKIHSTSEYNFRFLTNSVSESSVVGVRIRNKIQQDPNFLKSLRLQTFNGDGQCRYSNGVPSMATYENGVICFDILLINQKHYSKDEAPAKLAALYAHEVGHAAGFTSSVDDEKLLGKFQDGFEELLSDWRYNPNDLRDSFLAGDVGPRLTELSAANREDRSLVWLCTKLQLVMDRTSHIPISNFQESRGLSFMTNEQTAVLDVMNYEVLMLIAVNCDGYADNYKHWINWNPLFKDPRSVVTVNEAIELAFKRGFWCKKKYGPKVCEAASVEINIKPQELGKFRIQAAKWAEKTYTYLRQFDRAQ